MTGPIPAELGSLVNLGTLDLGGVNLGTLDFGGNDLSGPIPDELGNLVNLERLGLSYNWGLSGPLPSGLETAPLEALDIFVTRTCAPAAWQEWLATIEFTGRLCEVGTDVTIDIAVFYTPAARAAAGGTAAIEAEIDLLIAETNQAYAESGVQHRLVLVERSQVQYTETGDSFLDIDRLAKPSDGHMDGVHALRDRTGADLVHLLFEKKGYVGAIARGPFGLTCQSCGGEVFAHEVGHNMGLQHDRYRVHHNEGGVSPHPAHGYVNQRAFAAGAARSSRWRTIMSYENQCADADTSCSGLLRFSNPRQSYNGDPLGVPYGEGSGVTGPADAAAVLNATGPAVALWRNRPAGANRPPAASGTLPDRALTLPGTLTVDVSPAFVDPDGDRLTYAVSSSAPARGDGAGGGRPRDADGGGCRQGDDRGDGDRPRRPERHAGVHGDGGGDGDRGFHRRPDRGWGDAGQGRPLHRAAGAHRRSAGRGGAGAVPLDGPGPAGGGDAGQARASAGTAGGAGRRVYGSGAGGAALD